MRSILIKNVKPVILNQEQWVIIELYQHPDVLLSATHVFQQTTLCIQEVELLIGSKLNEDTGLFKLQFQFPTFDLQFPVNELRIKNAHLLLPYEMITGIFSTSKFKKERVGIKTEQSKVIYLPPWLLETECGLQQKLQRILLLSFVLPEYYKKGETFQNGSIVQYDNVLKALNLRYSGTITEMQENYIEEMDSIKEQEESEADSLHHVGRKGDEITFRDAFEDDESNYWNVD